VEWNFSPPQSVPFVSVRGGSLAISLNSEIVPGPIPELLSTGFGRELLDVVAELALGRASVSWNRRKKQITANCGESSRPLAKIKRLESACAGQVAASSEITITQGLSAVLFLHSFRHICPIWISLFIWSYLAAAAFPRCARQLKRMADRSLSQNRLRRGERQTAERVDDAVGTTYAGNTVKDTGQQDSPCVDGDFRS